jgi:predicted GNAT family N-acyltransferase
MAVLPAARRRGAASRLLEVAEQRARARGARRMALSAQVAVVGLYERAGYTAHGDVYLDAGIDHIDMDKPLHA